MEKSPFDKSDCPPRWVGALSLGIGFLGLTILIATHFPPNGVVGRAGRFADGICGKTFNLLMLIGGPVAFVWRMVVIERWRRRNDIRAGRIAEGRCPECGYDLKATPNRCPECGQFTESAKTMSA